MIIIFPEKIGVCSFHKQVPPELCTEGAGKMLFDGFVDIVEMGDILFQEKRGVCSFHKQVPPELCTEGAGEDAL